jgi:hypothetical protein
MVKVARKDPIKTNLSAHQAQRHMNSQLCEQDAFLMAQINSKDFLNRSKSK